MYEIRLLAAQALRVSCRPCRAPRVLQAAGAACPASGCMRCVPSPSSAGLNRSANSRTEGNEGNNKKQPKLQTKITPLKRNGFEQNFSHRSMTTRPSRSNKKIAKRSSNHQERKFLRKSSKNGEKEKSTGETKEAHEITEQELES
jgi:hypothetical protein